MLGAQTKRSAVQPTFDAKLKQKFIKLNALFKILILM